MAITRAEWNRAVQWAWQFVKEAGIPVKEEEKKNIEVADCGFGQLKSTGLQILTFISTEWLGAKLLILMPNQFFPQHKHPPSKDKTYPGKTEYLRGQYGSAYLYVSGKAVKHPSVMPPVERKAYCTVWKEVSLFPGDSYTCPPDTWHWFQAGGDGAIIWSISSKVTDNEDQFSDPNVVRKTTILE